MSNMPIPDRVISHLREEGYVIDDRDAAEIRAHLKAMLDGPDGEQSFDDLVASVMVYKNLTTDSGCHADDCAGCATPCTWNGDWYIDATSPMGERDTFGSYLEEADAYEAMKRLKEKGYTDFTRPYHLAVLNDVAALALEPKGQNWFFRATSPDDEPETFKNYDTPEDAREAMNRLQAKGYTDFNGPFPS